MRFLVRSFLLMMIFSMSIDCYSQSAMNFDYIKKYKEGFFIGAQVRVESGKEVVQFALIPTHWNEILYNIESMYGHIVEVLWIGEMETVVEKDERVRVIRINENPSAMQNKSEMYKNVSVENIYNYLLNNRLTHAAVSIKPTLIKYDKNVEYIHLGADPYEIDMFRMNFRVIVADIMATIELHGPEQATSREQLVDRLRVNVPFFLHRYVTDLASFNIMTGLTYEDAYLLYELLDRLSKDPNKLTNDEWTGLDTVLREYEYQQLLPDFYEVTFSAGKGPSIMKQRMVAEEVLAMRNLVEQKMSNGGMTLAEVVKINPNFFSDENLLYLLNEAKIAKSKDEETTIMEEMTSLIDAKEKNGISIGDELKNKYVDVADYLDGEKDVYIMAARLKKLGFSDSSDAITKLLDQGGLLNEDTAKLFFGTKERDFEDGIYNFIQKYNIDVSVKNKLFLLSILFVANKGEVKIESKMFNLQALIVKMMRRNGAFFKEFKSFNIQEELTKTNVKIELEKALMERERIKIDINLERDRFK